LLSWWLWLGSEGIESVFAEVEGAEPRAGGGEEAGEAWGGGCGSFARVKPGVQGYWDACVWTV
jgi:hypothetical protein